MPEYTYPGPRIQEVSGGPGPIAGVSTSNLGLIGFTKKGPVDEPILSTSFNEFKASFGDFTEDGLTPTMAYAFFQNGGQRLYTVRVTASDAEDALWDYLYSITSASPEELGDTAEGTGIYSLQIDNAPIDPTSVEITFNSGSTDNVFTDAAGDGVLTKTSGAGSGGTGSINYTTGEVSITLAVPGDYTGGADKIEAVYDYVVFQFRMKWPGEAGNYYRVSIVPGDSDYLTQATASYSRFTVLVEEDTDAGVTGVPSWVTVEQFTDLVFNDTSSPNYIETVINADYNGSDIIEVVGYGNEMNPPELQGTQVTAEDFSGTMVHSDGSSASTPDVYDGLWKGWTYDLANGCFPTTFDASFKFSDGAIYASGADDSGGSGNAFLTDSTAAWPVNGLVGLILYNTADGSHGVITANTATTATATLAGGTGNDWDDTDTYEIRAPLRIGTGAAGPVAVADVVSPGSTSVPAAITPSSVKITVQLTTAGSQVIVDDGSGNLWDGVAGACGTIDYTTGQIAYSGTDDQIDISGVTAWAADTIVAGAPIWFACDYATAISVVDDGDGNLSLNTTQATGYPQKFILDENGTNEIDYDTGGFTLTWAVSGSPALGPGGATAQTADYTQPDESVTGQMTGGSDGSALTSNDVVGATLAADQRGLWAFGKVDELMQLVASDFQTDTTVADSLITYAELNKDKFVILTVPAGLTPQEAVNWKKFQLQKFTSYAALYYPHIKIIDPVTEVATDVPCGGHVAGVYARTDITKNVGKAPAGVEDGKINWAVGLELDLTRDQVGVCYPEKINCLVQWPQTGRCVWGARTLDIAGGEWPYIQMRRLFMFCEKSVFNATHTHVFKNNGPSLWAAIRTQVSSFLLGLYQAGYFAGTSAEDAFYVICDRTNNPQNTVDQGLVFCDIGIAPNKPAEFIVFRFQQKALTA